MCHHYESERLTEYEFAYETEKEESDDDEVADLDESEEFDEIGPAVPPADD
ncbi:hypothetical protein [Halostella pelagica]|uniref:hypothetical protein n=1 Tax=Halostella pelagica TaxID=2583824 RepID=UPI001386F929|nr:hypothetical protein [Halostella pelagica]